MQFNSQEAEISIHAPRVGSDSSGKSWWSWPGHFNPRSPCGERRDRDPLPLFDALISIHAPRVGSDPHTGCRCRR